MYLILEDIGTSTRLCNTKESLLESVGIWTLGLFVGRRGSARSHMCQIYILSPKRSERAHRDYFVLSQMSSFVCKLLSPQSAGRVERRCLRLALTATINFARQLETGADTFGDSRGTSIFNRNSKCYLLPTHQTSPFVAKMSRIEQRAGLMFRIDHYSMYTFDLCFRLAAHQTKEMLILYACHHH